ncbi:hypothetical protein ABIC09_006205 [Bradyrhizobium sp. S3.12.5]|uniref:hypothetical protein n=1 Tax=Bradyrhizobium sp. S3.12.5 TaxID=3156386 RepID=UPI003398D3E9
MTTTAALSLKELKSIIELSSAGRIHAGSDANRHYRRRDAAVEAITCIASIERWRHDSVARRRKGFSQDHAIDRGIVSSPFGAHIKLCYVIWNDRKEMDIAPSPHLPVCKTSLSSGLG